VGWIKRQRKQIIARATVNRVIATIASNGVIATIAT
jgi:hypothetical protein